MGAGGSKSVTVSAPHLDGGRRPSQGPRRIAGLALTATIHTVDIDLTDHDRGIYETLALRVARHPSESDDYLVTRVLAYALEHAPGIAFSTGGLSAPDEPPITMAVFFHERPSGARSTTTRSCAGAVR